MLPIQLPPSLNGFVGHEDDLVEIARLLTPASPTASAVPRPAVRLLTLMGPGGIGKSRLAIEAARNLASHYRDGVRYIPLAAVDDPDLAAVAIARAIGASLSPARSAGDALCAFLQDKHLLLLLDDFDPVVSAAPLIADLLAAAPSVTCLVTSREPLHIPGEQEFPVPPLTVPDPRNLPPIAGLLNFSAIALFVQRAQAVRPDFILTDNSAPAADRVCRGLDGLPLAIELAAARAKTLSVEQIAARLSDCFDLLTQGSRTALPRHQTLRAAIGWSYDLLAETERNLFRRLAVFAGGFTLAGALAVGACDGEAPSVLLDRLTVLVDKSMIMAVPSQAEARYRILETIRRYAIVKLSEAGETPAVQRRHLEFLLARAEDAGKGLSGTDQEANLAWFDTERANLLSALNWCLATSEVEGGRRLIKALEPYWERRGAPKSSAWLSKLQSLNDGISTAGDQIGSIGVTPDTRFAQVDAATEPRLTIFAFGAERVHLGDEALPIADWTYTKAREMLFYLLSSPPRTKEQIGLALWPDASDTQLHNNFRVTLHHLRRALGQHQWILFENGGYRFNRSLPHWIDVEAFETHVVAAKNSLDADQAIADLEAAIGIYRGDFLENLNSDWPMLRREELRRLHLGALLLLGRLLFAGERYPEAIEIYRRALAQDNFLETAHRGVMRGLARLGERSQALRHFDALVTLLNVEMGSPPARETVALAERLRHDDQI
jgi:predicted ATPase/DNA-binding SARP family transcriptional activator